MLEVEGRTYRPTNLCCAYLFHPTLYKNLCGKYCAKDWGGKNGIAESLLFEGPRSGEIVHIEYIS